MHCHGIRLAILQRTEWQDIDTERAGPESLSGRLSGFISYVNLVRMVLVMTMVAGVYPWPP